MGILIGSLEKVMTDQKHDLLSLSWPCCLSWHDDANNHTKKPQSTAKDLNDQDLDEQRWVLRIRQGTAASNYPNTDPIDKKRKTDENENSKIVHCICLVPYFGFVRKKAPHLTNGSEVVAYFEEMVHNQFYRLWKVIHNFNLPK